MSQTEFEAIVSEVYPLMLRVGMDFFRERSDAEDAAQDAVVRLWRYCERIPKGQRIEGLAVRIAKCCCIDLQRRRHGELFRSDETRQQKDSDESLTLTDAIAASPSPHEQLEAAEAQIILNEIVARLKPRKRSLFELRQLHGLSNDEIAERTGIPKDSIKAMVSAARRKVMEELKRRLNM